MKDKPFREKMLSPRPKKYIKARTKVMEKDLYVQSPMEFEISNFLKSINEKFIAEKQFPDLESLVSGVNLKLDFYLIRLKAVIEYDGIQHFVRMRGESQNSFDRRQLSDLTKNLFCKQRGIKLLRIKYTQKQYYKEIILDFIKSIENESIK